MVRILPTRGRDWGHASDCDEALKATGLGFWDQGWGLVGLGFRVYGLVFRGASGLGLQGVLNPKPYPRTPHAPSALIS